MHRTSGNHSVVGAYNSNAFRLGEYPTRKPQCFIIRTVTRCSRCTTKLDPTPLDFMTCYSIKDNPRILPRPPRKLGQKPSSPITASVKEVFREETRTMTRYSPITETARRPRDITSLYPLFSRGNQNIPLQRGISKGRCESLTPGRPDAEELALKPDAQISSLRWSHADWLWPLSPIALALSS